MEEIIILEVPLDLGKEVDDGVMPIQFGPVLALRPELN